MNSELKEKIETLQNCCIDLCTGGDTTYQQYERARANLFEEPSIVGKVPKWLRDCRYGSRFWDFIKPKFTTYRERRQFLFEEFQPLLEFAEKSGVDPTSDGLDQILIAFTSETIHDAWRMCFERKETDPAGAITSARSLLESTCKHILDELKIPYEMTEDLPKLYKLTAKSLNLSPDQHSEQVFRQILGGCGAVVEGLGALRNKLGDAHGKGKVGVKPTRRHAELAVNLSGTVCCFLISTFEEKFTTGTDNKTRDSDAA